MQTYFGDIACGGGTIMMIGDDYQALFALLQAAGSSGRNSCDKDLLAFVEKTIRNS
jgi:hypothetical protein